MKPLHRAVEGEMSIGDFLKYKRESEERITAILSEINDKLSEINVYIESVDVDIHLYINALGEQTSGIVSTKFEVNL